MGGAAQGLEVFATAPAVWTGCGRACGPRPHCLGSRSGTLGQRPTAPSVGPFWPYSPPPTAPADDAVVTDPQRGVCCVRPHPPGRCPQLWSHGSRPPSSARPRLSVDRPAPIPGPQDPHPDLGDGRRQGALLENLSSGGGSWARPSVPCVTGLRSQHAAPARSQCHRSPWAQSRAGEARVQSARPLVGRDPCPGSLPVLRAVAAHPLDQSGVSGCVEDESPGKQGGALVLAPRHPGRRPPRPPPQLPGRRPREPEAPPPR